VVVAVNALMVLPYVLRVLGPALARVDADYDRLCANLGLAGLHRLRRVDGPLARGPIGFALALGLALSLGDLGAIALFGTQDTATLPLLLYQRLGNYRVAEAASLSLWLAIVCLLLFVVVERLVGGRGRR
jgi:thiamine transport system permease protein